ncbi:unnamed protein product [Ceutorhynchus assimilis]|uniref:RCC1-like domain-containing protein n=1 Tax=Ceutorhynchus assimilis TaxID=467358 RepID=A0A9N9MA45_9CUCU|nr:unnamed protein product [Ceutorhynchus assimilis]
MAPNKRKHPSSTPTKTTNQIINNKKGRFNFNQIELPELRTEGVLLVSGSGDVGQLGLGPDILEKSRPALVTSKHEIVDIYAGGMHTVCLTKAGKVLTFGCNDEGTLGRLTEDEDDSFVPGEVAIPGKVIQISAGDSHSAALMDDGRVFAWGTFRDCHGGMGLSVNGSERLPIEIIKQKKIVKIASGDDHLVFLTDTGEVWTCGRAEQGQLGRTTKRSSDRAEIRKNGDGIKTFVNPAPISLKPSLKLRFDNIWASTSGTFAKVANKDDIYVFGLNNFHQISLGQVEAQYLPKRSQDFSKYKWQHITGGMHHTLGLTVDGEVYAIGRKEYGRLGLGKNCEDATILTKIKGLTGTVVVNIACGSMTSFAVSNKGQLYGWGMGTNGQLGLGNDEDAFEPTPIESKQLKDKKVMRVSSGGQHTLILATTTEKKINGH